MDCNNINDIKKAGFIGFKSVSELFVDSSSLPSIKGVYLILNINSNQPSFLEAGTGSYFKGKNPNVSMKDLNDNWVKNTLVVYIGKAGKDGSSATLKSRLEQYLGFGRGGNVGHYGGRLIWQIASSDKLVVCWKPLPNQDPRMVEAQLIHDFTNHYGIRPFANLAD